MREVWANGRPYRSISDFARAAGMNTDDRQNYDYTIKKCIKTGKPFFFLGKGYILAEIPGVPPYVNAKKSRQRATESSAYSLLARGYSTQGLHQDKGEHFTEARV